MVSTRIFYATDIHGSDRCFFKFINAGKVYKANAIVLGGDITGKMVIPIVEGENSTFTTEFLGTKYVLKEGERLQDLEKRIRMVGYYPYRTTQAEMEGLNEDNVRVYRLFSRLMFESVSRWAAVAENRLKGTGIVCFMTPGNDDRLEIDEALKSSDYVVNPEGRVVNIDRYHEMISTGYANMTPWKCPRDVTEEELSQKIESMVKGVVDMRNCIFNFHCPPYDSSIDLAPELDQTLKPILVAGSVRMIPVGSKSVRQSIEKYQPLVGLHGHIHESRGETKIMRTLCVNPGSEYGEGILRGVIIDLEKEGIGNCLFTSG